jgi:hypothetical protein
MKYGILFWDNSSNSKEVFTLQKKTIGLMMDVKSHNSYRALFKRLQILTLPCEHIISLINFITDKEKHFQNNAAVHSVNTRHGYYLHKSTDNFSCFQKSAYYIGIRLFNYLPSDLKSLVNEKS